jgi:hypothetical protein
MLLRMRIYAVQIKTSRPAGFSGNNGPTEFPVAFQTMERAEKYLRDHPPGFYGEWWRQPSIFAMELEV